MSGESTFAVRGAGSDNSFQGPIISREVFDRLSRIHKAALLVMQESGEVRIEESTERGEQTPAQQRWA